MLTFQNCKYVGPGRDIKKFRPFMVHGSCTNIPSNPSFVAKKTPRNPPFLVSVLIKNYVKNSKFYDRLVLKMM